VRVTGPKTDIWLVKTVGLVLATIGATLVFAQLNAQANSPVIFLAIGSALSLAIVEIVYVAKRVISPVYLGDAFVELVLIGW
jgi:energy-converting hydrogenase Eha subunit E